MKRICVYLLVCSCFLLSCGPGKKPVFGSISGIIGKASIYKMSKRAWIPAKLKMTVSDGDSIRTSEESHLEIRFDTDNSLKLGESTTVCIRDSLNESKSRDITVLDVCGEVLSDVKRLGTGSRYEVRTPTSVAAVRGTHFHVVYMPVAHVTHVNVFHGKVHVWNPFLPPAPPITVLPGFFTVVEFRHAPVFPVKMNYGQFKKMERLLGHHHFKHYHGKFKFSDGPHPFGPPGHGPGHMFKDMKKMQGKMGKKGPDRVFGPGKLPGKDGPISKGKGKSPAGKRKKK